MPLKAGDRFDIAHGALLAAVAIVFAVAVAFLWWEIPRYGIG